MRSGRIQNLIGAFTGLLWIFVGIYFIGATETVGWQVAGGVAVAFGIMRLIALVLGLREPKPLNEPEEPREPKRSS